MVLHSSSSLTFDSNNPLFTTATSSFVATFPTTCFFLDTTALGQSPLELKVQFPQSLPNGVQIVCPNPTSKWLISCHLSLGSQPWSAFLVSSGVFVLCHFHRFVIRWTCTSTPMPSVRPQAAERHKYPIFGPTPGRLVRPSIVSGMSPPNRSRRIRAAALMYFVLLLWNPTA